MSVAMPLSWLPLISDYTREAKKPIAAIVYPMDNITDFLYLIGSVFAPMIDIHIADYFILKKDAFHKDFQISNLVIWLIGFIAYRMLMRVDNVVGNTLPDIVITVILCLIFHMVVKIKNKDSIVAAAKHTLLIISLISVTIST